jgi:Tol biopolymer transport system component
VLSAAHYSATDAVSIAVFQEPTLTASRYELAWTDLHASDPNTGWGILARSGDPRQAATPTWWHDGSNIAYTSSASVGEGVISAPDATDPTMDIYVVPFNNRQGGTATPLAGASDPNAWEFYPVISPDDALLAFNRTAPVAAGDSYDEPAAEVFVVPASGGTALRLESNDPPACTGKVSPGLTNSWPRWAPSAEEHAGKRYYWVIFSSKRRDPGHPQLFISGVVTTVSGGTETIERGYPALYVTSQTTDEANHTPAWDIFKVKPPS